MEYDMTIILPRLGITFENKKEASAFADIIQDELEIRIGEALYKEMYPSKRENDDLSMLLIDMEKEETDLSQWLEDNLPTYVSIVNGVKDDMERELIQYRSQIPGIKRTPVIEMDCLSLEDLDISARSFNCLARAGIRTVADYRAYKDVCKIRNFGEKCKKEVNQKINEQEKKLALGQLASGFNRRTSDSENQ